MGEFKLRHYPWDDWEAGTTSSMLLLSEEEADAEADEVDGRVSEVPVLLARPPLLQRLGRDSLPPLLVPDMLLTVWTEDRTSLDGVWWDDRLAPERLLAPRGVILLGRLSSWERERLAPAAPRFG